MEKYKLYRWLRGGIWYKYYELGWMDYFTMDYLIVKTECYL